MALTGLRAMGPIDAPAPAIRHDDEIRLKLTMTGVCGSDIHYYTAGRIGSQVVQYPFRVGHECAGVVVETGAAVSNVNVGDRVAIDPAMPCGACDQCLRGRAHTCRKLRFLGCPGQAEGSLAEEIVLPAHCAFPIRRETSFEQAVLSEPLAIGVYACKLAGDLKGKKIGILGFGPIGMSVLLPARMLGAAAVYITDRIEPRLQIGRESGAVYAGNIDTSDVVAEISEQEPLLLDYVFECCGMQEAMDHAIQLLAPGGKLIQIGIPEFDRASFRCDMMRRKEVVIQNVRRQNDCTKETLDLIESGAIDTSRMVTHHLPFEKTKEAFDMVAGYRDGVMKAMIVQD